MRMSLANVTVQFHGIGHDEMADYSKKWVGQKVKKKPYLRDETEYTVVHAQKVMGEALKLNNGEWVKPWELVGH